MKVSLYAQATAVDLASSFDGRSPPKMRDGERKMLEDGLKAATRTLWTIQNWRDRLPAEFVDEGEGEP